MRALLASSLAGLLVVACTPEARVVDPPAGEGGEPNGSQGQPDGGSDCRTPTSPRVGCAACMASACAKEMAACGDTACACGDFGDTRGEINCLLACPEIEPEMSAVEGCAQGCGFGNLMQADRSTVELWECLVVPPRGPPACPECFNNK